MFTCLVTKMQSASDGKGNREGSERGYVKIIMGGSMVGIFE